MPHLACWSCGQSIYATSPLESLFAEEQDRRLNPPADPGPPPDGERRVGERRSVERRRGR